MAEQYTEPGAIIDDKYRVVRVLGQGGMGVVLEAEHLQLPQRVAIKLLKPELKGPVVERFAREARAAVQIQSEHVCRVFDVGTLPGGQPFMVMEMLNGFDLSVAMLSGEQLPIRKVCDYVLQACEALAEAHILGIVHRDLKPANLFVSKRPDGSDQIKLLDFGVSKVNAAAGAGADGLTQTDAILGSPRFMSPEQLRATSSVDNRTDIWSLGVTMYEALAGEPAFPADSVADLCVKVLQDPPQRLTEARSDVPAGLEAVLLRCMEKHRERRYANVAELALALQPFGSARAKLSVERIVGVYEATGWSPPASLPRAASLDEAASLDDAASLDEPASFPSRSTPDALVSSPDLAELGLDTAETVTAHHEAPSSKNGGSPPTAAIGEPEPALAVATAATAATAVTVATEATEATEATAARPRRGLLFVAVVVSLGATVAIWLALSGTDVSKPSAASPTSSPVASTASTTSEETTAETGTTSAATALSSASATATASHSVRTSTLSPRASAVGPGKNPPASTTPSQNTSVPAKTTPTSTPTVSKSVVPKPKVDCSGDNAFVRDEHGGLKVRPECMK